MTVWRRFWSNLFTSYNLMPLTNTITFSGSVHLCVKTTTPASVILQMNTKGSRTMLLLMWLLTLLALGFVCEIYPQNCRLLFSRVC